MRQHSLRAELGAPSYYAAKAAFKLQRLALSNAVFPLLNRKRYFAELHQLITEGFCIQ